ncbi:hypothetical protein BG011_008461 [Mortierella polycephala]|uniref:Uncharacterized protein n=1 Tax=Mortierella polycephala TaxID=41804 RepID=A0A9P6QJS4_9FUNG|nr:hypothetical protein BG011_008461 [Mortierella polycephala]
MKAHAPMVLGPMLLLTFATRVAYASEPSNNVVDILLGVNGDNKEAAVTTEQHTFLAPTTVQGAMKEINVMGDGSGGENDGNDEGDDEDDDEDEVDGDLDFHYADPLLVPLHKEEQSHAKQERDQTGAEPAVDSTSRSTEMTKVITPEPGAACQDSLVNFADQFRERCSFPCLKTVTRVVSNPDVLPLLNCFGCINFFFDGFSALITDCSGLLASPLTMIVGAKVLKSKTKAAVDAEETMGGVPLSQKQEAQEQAATEAGIDIGNINFADTIKALQQVDVKDMQEWINLGQGVYDALEAAAGAEVDADGNATGGGGAAEGQRKKEGVEKSKELFNKLVSKAASIVNLPLTPEMLDATAMYDTAHAAGIL